MIFLFEDKTMIYNIGTKIEIENNVESELDNINSDIIGTKVIISFGGKSISFSILRAKVIARP